MSMTAPKPAVRTTGRVGRGATAGAAAASPPLGPEGRSMVVVMVPPGSCAGLPGGRAHERLGGVMGDEHAVVQDDGHDALVHAGVLALVEGDAGEKAPEL